MEDWNEGDEQARLLSMLAEAWIKRVTKEEAKRAKSNHTVKMMLPKEYHTNVVAWTRKNVARDVKQHSVQNAFLITVSGDREKTAMCRLDECDVSGQTIRQQAIPARMSCDEILEWVGEEVLKEYRNLHHTRGLRPGDRDVNYVGEGPGGEAAMDPVGADGDEALVDDDDDDEPAEMAVCAFVADNGAGNNQGSWKPLQPGWKKKEKKDPRRIGSPPLSFGEFIRAHPQGCFVCYGRKQGFNHDHRTCPIHQADTEAYKEAHRLKRRAPAGIREAKVEVDKDELSKLMSQGTELAREIQEIKRNGVPRSDNKNKENNQNDQNKDKDKKPRNRRRKGVNEVDAEENTPTSTTSWCHPSTAGVRKARGETHPAGRLSLADEACSSPTPQRRPTTGVAPPQNHTGAPALRRVASSKGCQGAQPQRHHQEHAAARYQVAPSPDGGPKPRRREHHEITWWVISRHKMLGVQC